MSAREGLAAARAALEIIADVCTDVVAKRVAERALETVNAAASKAEARRLADRDRKAELRKSAGRPPDGGGSPPTSAGRPQVSDGHGEGGEGGGVGSDRSTQTEIQDRNDTNHLGGPGGVRTMSDGNPRMSSGHAVKNVTDDGAMGLAVAAWCDGIREITKRPYTPPRGEPLRLLIEAMAEHRAGAEPVAWARETVHEFVRSSPGGIYDVFRFVNWLNSNRPSSTRLRPLAPVQPERAGGRLWKMGKQ